MICRGVASFSSFSGRFRAPTQTATVPEVVPVASATLKAPTSLVPFLPITLTKTRASGSTALLLRRFSRGCVVHFWHVLGIAAPMMTVAGNTRSRLEFSRKWFSPYFTMCFSLMCFTICNKFLASRSDRVSVNTRLFYDFFCTCPDLDGYEASYRATNMRHDT